MSSRQAPPLPGPQAANSPTLEGRQPAPRSSLRLRTWLCTAIVVLSNAFGDFFMKRGLPGDTRLSTPLEYVTILFQPWVTLGVILLVVWQLSRMTLLSWADLSYVLPVTSIGYVLVAVIGWAFLNESISATRWAGILLIMSGVALVSSGSAPSTVQRHEAKR